MKKLPFPKLRPIICALFSCLALVRGEDSLRPVWIFTNSVFQTSYQFARVASDSQGAIYFAGSYVAIPSIILQKYGGALRRLNTSGGAIYDVSDVSQNAYISAAAYPLPSGSTYNQLFKATTANQINSLDFGTQITSAQLLPDGSVAYLKITSSSRTLVTSASTFNTDADRIYRDPEGNWIFTREFSGTLTTPDGIFIANATDLLVGRLDVTGSTLWVKQFSSPGNEQCFAIRPTADGVFLAGWNSANSAFAISGGSYVAKLTYSGELLWTFSSPGVLAFDFCITPQQELFVCGGTTSRLDVPVLQKSDSTGHLIKDYSTQVNSIAPGQILSLAYTSDDHLTVLVTKANLNFTTNWIINFATDPRLAIARDLQSGNLRVSWPAANADFSLRQAPNLESNFTTIAATRTTNSGLGKIEVALPTVSTQSILRLFHP